MDEPGLRSDARRNRELVLQVADTVFAAEGPQVPLTEIARRAGVGAGTVHRHFPTKDALVSAVIEARIEQFTAEARRVAERADPGVAFFEFIEWLVGQVAVNKALCATLVDDPGTVPAAAMEFRDALDVVVEQARQAGAIGADVTSEDVSALVLGCVTMERVRDVPGRMTRLALAALKVTKDVDRNETRCVMCGGPVRTPATGRRPKFCGAACRQRAHRRRHGDVP